MVPSGAARVLAMHRHDEADPHPLSDGCVISTAQAEDPEMDRLQGSLVQAAIKRLVREFKHQVKERPPGVGDGGWGSRNQK